MTEVETPPEAYYDLLRIHLAGKYPGANPYLLDHMISLEAFLDKSIVSGFSFGCGKAQVVVPEGKLLGHHISRQGAKPDEERIWTLLVSGN